MKTFILVAIYECESNFIKNQKLIFAQILLIHLATFSGYNYLA